MAQNNQFVYNVSFNVSNLCSIFLFQSTSIMISNLSAQRSNYKHQPRLKNNHRRSITQSSRVQILQQNYPIGQKHKRLHSHKDYSHKFYKNQMMDRSKFANIYIKNASKNQEAIQANKIRKLILSGCIDTNEHQRGNKQNNQIEKFQKKSCLTKKHRSRTNMLSAKVTFTNAEKTFLIENNNTSENFFNKNNTTQQLKRIQNSCSIDLQIWKLQVTKICKSLQQLKKFGSVQKKIHKWCTNYFQSKKRGLIELFMKKVYKKKSLNNEVNYFAIMEKQILLSKIIQYIEDISDKEKYFLGIEITLYRTFLEQKIANKHKLELNQIQNRVKSNIQTACMKGFARQLYQTINTSPEVIGFFADLQRIQETYGKLNLLSLKNRKRFQNINESQVNIKKLIHN